MQIFYFTYIVNLMFIHHCYYSFIVLLRSVVTSHFISAIDNLGFLFFFISLATGLTISTDLLQEPAFYLIFFTFSAVNFTNFCCSFLLYQFLRVEAKICSIETFCASSFYAMNFPLKLNQCQRKRKRYGQKLGSKQQKS